MRSQDVKGEPQGMGDKVAWVMREKEEQAIKTS